MTIQNNEVKYKAEFAINSIQPGVDVGSRLEYACRNNIPYIDDLLQEHVGSSAMVKNTLVNAFLGHTGNNQEKILKAKK